MPGASSWFQKTIKLPAKARGSTPPFPFASLPSPHLSNMQRAGSYLITSEIADQLPELANYKMGLLTLFIQHTSCALSLNENWDSDVRLDMSDALDRIVPEDRKNEGIYRHDSEGSDDMPAHVKSALVGASVTVPITDGQLALGTWQGTAPCRERDLRADGWRVKNRDLVHGVSTAEARSEYCRDHQWRAEVASCRNAGIQSKGYIQNKVVTLVK